VTLNPYDAGLWLPPGQGFPVSATDDRCSPYRVGPDRSDKNGFRLIIGHRTSQWPPLAGPIRRRRPWFFSLSICLRTARLEIPRSTPSCSVVTALSWRIRSNIRSSVFTELFGELFGEPSVLTDTISELFTVFRCTIAVNRQPSRSSIKSISGQASSARLIPEPRPR